MTDRAWGHGSIPVDLDWVRYCQQTMTITAAGALGLLMSPGRTLVRVRRRPFAPGPTQGGIGANRGPRGRYGGNTGGRMAVLEIVWWGS